jgi:hypothetical protein
LDPGGGKPATYLYALQRTNCGSGNPACVASPSTAGLSFYRSNDEGQTWSFYKPINPSNWATGGSKA